MCTPPPARRYLPLYRARRFVYFVAATSPGQCATEAPAVCARLAAASGLGSWCCVWQRCFLGVCDFPLHLPGDPSVRSSVTGGAELGRWAEEPRVRSCLFLRADGCRGWRRLRTAVGVGLRAPSARVSSRPGDGPAGTSRFCPLRSSMTEG